jgi:hypothetical protein
VPGALIPGGVIIPALIWVFSSEAALPSWYCFVVQLLLLTCKTSGPGSRFKLKAQFGTPAMIYITKECDRSLRYKEAGALNRSRWHDDGFQFRNSCRVHHTREQRAVRTP